MRKCIPLWLKSSLMSGVTAVGLVLFLSTATVSCVGNRPPTCERQSDCTRMDAGFCSGAGFCESECASSTDCPCGSFCAKTCNICVRDDLKGPATCFPFSQGMTVAEILGVCQDSFGDKRESTPYCELDPVTPTQCGLTVRIDAGAATSAGPAGGPEAPDAGLAEEVEDVPTRNEELDVAGGEVEL
jgi:hypothetical protein